MRFVLLVVFSLLAAFPLYAAADLQTACSNMQKALDAYQAAVLQPSPDFRLVSVKRDEYLAAKQVYETLKKIPQIQNETKTRTQIQTLYSVQKKSKEDPEHPRPITASQAVARVLEKITSGARVTEQDMNNSFEETNDNTLELQPDETFWHSVTKDIQGAKKSIHIQMFGMEADNTGWEFARMLAEKAKQGVDVVIVADRSGARMMGPKNVYSTTEEEKLFKFYKDNGVKVVFYARATKATTLGQKLDFFHFDHRKKFVIDGEIGYVGGYTLQQTSRETKHDMMVRCQGSVVQQMHAELMLSYLYSGGKIPPADAAKISARDFSPPQNRGTMNGRMTYNIPRGVHDVQADYLREIDSAKKYLYIINPYITNDEMIDHIAAAAKRGVDVRMVHPGSAENSLNDTGTRFHFEKLQKAGVKIYLYQGERGLGKLHAKGMIRDDSFASIGSTNMDTMSLRGNYESNVASKDAGFVKSVRENLFEKDFTVSTLYQPPKSLWERMKIKVKGGIAELVDRFD